MKKKWKKQKRNKEKLDKMQKKKNYLFILMLTKPKELKGKMKLWGKMWSYLKSFPVIFLFFFFVLFSCTKCTSVFVLNYFWQLSPLTHTFTSLFSKRNWISMQKHNKNWCMWEIREKKTKCKKTIRFFSLGCNKSALSWYIYMK